jgi:DnaJ-domain-containing protein 1
MTAADMLAKAQACEKLADDLYSESDRMVMRDVAELWRMLAKLTDAVRAERQRLDEAREKP